MNELMGHPSPRPLATGLAPCFLILLLPSVVSMSLDKLLFSYVQYMTISSPPGWFESSSSLLCSPCFFQRVTSCHAKHGTNGWAAPPCIFCIFTHSWLLSASLNWRRGN